MSRLRILMADDHESEISDARELLSLMDHDVDTATTFSDALKYAQKNIYDIAVIDLGWFTDNTSGIHDKNILEKGGFRINDEVQNKNPNTIRILYSNRIDIDEIRETAVKKGMLCIKKSFNENSRQSLASMVKAFAYLSSDPRRMPNGQIIPYGFTKLEESIRKFYSDKQRHCCDYNKNVFIMTRFLPRNPQLEEIDCTLRNSLATHGLYAHRADDNCYMTDRNLWDNVCTYMICCKYGVAVLEDIIQEEFNPNVALEYGFMRGLGKHTLLLKEKRFHPRADILGTLYSEFDMLNINTTIDNAINQWVKEMDII